MLDLDRAGRSELPMTETHPIDRLFEVIRSRKGADPETSYTAKLFAQGTLKIAKKLGEEGVETALAGRRRKRRRARGQVRGPALSPARALGCTRA